MPFKRTPALQGGFKWKRFTKKALFIVAILVFLSLLPLIYYETRGRNSIERRQLRNSFESGDFDAAYAYSKAILEEKPMDPFVLTINGFSSYQLAIAQINNSNTRSYIDECIWSLRKSMLSKENSYNGRVFYVLGKAYYYKGQGYADLAVDYLEKAWVEFTAADIPEYLGLAYAGVGDYRGSVAAFTMALPEEPSDILLLSIARSYEALEEGEPAKAYLLRCLEISKDSKTIAAARLLLGKTLAKTGDSSGAEKEFLKAIEEGGENAEAHYQLGELYAHAGDTTRARAEWRRALRIDPTYGPARSRLN
jgi:tetratricopeptide (TPR) repeat protein